jgi:hypothetical protein
LLDAQAKLGELVKNRPPKKGKTREYGSSGGTIPSLPPTIDKKESHYLEGHSEPSAVCIGGRRRRRMGEAIVIFREIKMIPPKQPTA